MKVPTSLLRFTSRTPYTCNICLIHQSNALPKQISKHHFSTSRPPPSPPPSGFTEMPSRRLISLSGPDATHYLQGVITANLSPTIKRTSGFYAAFLNAQGRLLNDVFIYPQINSAGIEGWYIEVDAKEAERLAKHIKRYKLLAKFDVRLISEDELRVWSLWDGGSEGWTSHSLPGGEGAGKISELGCEDKRAPGMGRRLILPGSQKPDVGLDETDENAYRVRRYLRGVPEGQDELIREHALPQESNVDFMGGIDYRKGCYVGQELTIRTHHTGVVRKRVLPVMIYGSEEAPPTALGYSPNSGLDAGGIPRETSFGRVEKKGRSAGKWLSGVGNLGLGLCRLEIMTDMLVQGEAGGYKEGDEFKLEWEVDGRVEMVKAKAFIPTCSLLHQAKQV